MSFEMSPAQYESNLEWLEANNPHHPLLATLKKGHSSINVLYLRHAMQEDPPKEEPAARPGEEKGEDDFKDAPFAVVNLYREKRELIGTRRKLSNSFHDCESDQERAQVSDRIKSVQGQIGAINEKLRRWKENGQVPSTEDEAPPTEAELLRIINRLNSNISYHGQQIRVLANSADSEQSKAKIDEHEEKIRAARIERGRAKSQLEAIVQSQ